MGTPNAIGRENDVKATVRGTTFRAVYGIDGATLALFSADFGESSVELDGRDPAAAAAGQLRAMAEAAMDLADATAGSAKFMRDDEVNTG